MVEASIDYENAAEIGFKVAEMADRVKVIHAAIPGAQATWAFEMDDVRYRVVLTVEGRATDAGERA